MIKKIIKIFVIIGFILCTGILLLIAAGVNLIAGFTKTDLEPEDIKVPRIQAETVIGCVMEQDAEGIKELFAPVVANSYDLDKEIEELFHFFKGNIISYDEPTGKPRTKSKDYDGIIYEESQGRVENVVTDEGNTYNISVNGYYIYRNDFDYVGVWNMRVVDVDANYDISIQIGSDMP